MARYRYSIALGAMVLLLVVSNVLLIRQNLQLRASLKRFQPEKLKEGDSLTPFSANSLTGQTMSITYSGGERQRVLMFFSPNCPYSREQFTYWRKIIEMASVKNFEVFALARDSEDRQVVETYLKSVACPSESKNFHVVFIPETIRQTYKFVMTPTTVIASGDGKALKVWNGALTSKDIANADATLGL